ncbi:cation-transporting P-type ATPase [Kitasatospora sp. CM 4170]|uniref:Cation-transporting P-type ATPase n=1 Tax=Kitasatospora aburaviensis TaxID=67265 RepID=A0ABW1F6C0_9ACTN|nr:cation-transporting P-type ATPase [Kitasatospora sp. CM 4170]WNM43351.1 cation-transporting P-type ATPase [Kitasatospora sp. CM 4170]
MTRAVRRPAGLTEEQAARLLVEHGPNTVGAPPSPPLWSRAAAQLRDPLILVLLAAVVLTLATGDHADAVVIGFVVVVNTAVGVTQEVRADNAVAALSALSAPAARFCVTAGSARWRPPPWFRGTFCCSPRETSSPPTRT